MIGFLLVGCQSRVVSYLEGGFLGVIMSFMMFIIYLGAGTGHQCHRAKIFLERQPMHPFFICSCHTNRMKPIKKIFQLRLDLLARRLRYDKLT